MITTHSNVNAAHMRRTCGVRAAYVRRSANVRSTCGGSCGYADSFGVRAAYVRRTCGDCRGLLLASLPFVVVVVGFHACLRLIDATSDLLAAYAFTRFLDFTLVMSVVRAAYVRRTCGVRAAYAPYAWQTTKLQPSKTIARLSRTDIGLLSQDTEHLIKHI